MSEGELTPEEMLGGGDLEAAIGAVEDQLTDQDRVDGVDPNHPILSVAEQREAIAKARARVDSDTKREALKAFEQQAYDKQRGKTGMRTGDPRKDEMVYITIDLPEFCDKLSVNMQPYWHGFTYHLPRHMADSLKEMQARAWNHQSDIEGKGITERMRSPRVTHLSASGAVHNAPSQNVKVA